ncbi:MAG TPA: tetratricopeptide repeat protein, partial [Myxococcaceae bacterium]|nr:tetratricopeptide repeat protein [Myxococcaceae bacterium]
RDALAERLKLIRPDHPDLRFFYVDIAEGELLGGHPELALEPARTALELTRAAAGPDSPTTSLAQVQLAEALVGLKRPADAEPLARKALANWAAHPGLPDHAARGHFVLAKALALSAPAEALAEAEKARQGYAALESFRKVHAADVEAWVARLRASKQIRGPESR